MIEKHVYSPWAYTENEQEKGKMNCAIYRELTDKYKIAYSETIWNSKNRCREKVNLDDYDIVIDQTATGYAHNLYSVIKNAPKLSTAELALICDRGNLCFGHSIRGGSICIYTD